MYRKSEVKILVVSSKYPPEPAGSGLRAHRTYKRLAQKFGIRYKVLCGSVIFNRPAKYFFEGVSVYRVACKIFKNIENREEIDKESFLAGFIRRLKNVINYILEVTITMTYLIRCGFKFDLFHIYGKDFVTSAALIYAKVTRKPLIIESCNLGQKVTQYEPWPIRVIYGSRLPPYTKLVCISERLKNLWLNTGYTGEIWCRPNPVDNSKFFIDRENKFRYRRKLGLFGEEDILLITVGKIRPLKNQIFLIEVLKNLPPEYKLVIVGPPANSPIGIGEDRGYIDEIKRRIENFGLSRRVRLKDSFVDNVDEYIKAADIFLMPSKIEACCTALLEALVCGVPVVAHKIDGVTTEWVRDGMNGYLAPLDVESFKNKIEMAIDLNKEVLDKMAHMLAKRTSTELIDRRYVELFTELINRR